MTASAPITATPGPAAGRGSANSQALDQWRGLALVMVLVAHAFHTSGRVDGLGRVGVNLFFFISGILVFRSLSGSPGTPPWVRARTFWWRRLRRLYPAMLAYILFMAVAERWLQYIPGQNAGTDYSWFLRALPYALLCVANYWANVLPSLGHLWSVSCEMQFYLVAPLLWVWGGETPGRRNLVYCLVLGLLMGLGFLQPLMPSWGGYKYQFQFAVWPMMLGFVCEYHRPWLDRLPPRWQLLAFRTLAGVCLAAAPIMFLGARMKTPTVALGALLLVPCFMAYARGWPLASPVAGGALRWLGQRTYSIYLWQQAFTICYFLPVPWWFPGALVAVGVGAAWFEWFERPFLSASRPAPKAPVANAVGLGK